MTNAADRKSVRRAEKVADLAVKQDLEIISSIMDSVNGRAWLLRRIDPVFHTPYTPDANATAFNCGIQNEAIKLMSEVMIACPDNFILAMRESNERNAAAERSSRTNGDGGVEGSSSASGDGDDDLPGGETEYGDGEHGGSRPN